MITSRVAARLVAISPQESPRLPQMSGWSSGYWGTSERAPARGFYASAASGGSETSRKSVNARAATDETERCSRSAAPYNSRTSHPGRDRWMRVDERSSIGWSARRGAPSRAGGIFFISEDHCIRRLERRSRASGSVVPPFGFSASRVQFRSDGPISSRSPAEGQWPLMSNVDERRCGGACPQMSDATTTFG